MELWRLARQHSRRKAPCIYLDATTARSTQSAGQRPMTAVTESPQQTKNLTSSIEWRNQRFSGGAFGFFRLRRSTMSSSSRSLRRLRRHCRLSSVAARRFASTSLSSHRDARSFTATVLTSEHVTLNAPEALRDTQGLAVLPSCVSCFVQEASRARSPVANGLVSTCPRRGRSWRRFGPCTRRT